MMLDTPKGSVPSYFLTLIVKGLALYDDTTELYQGLVTLVVVSARFLPRSSLSDLLNPNPLENARDSFRSVMSLSMTVFLRSTNAFTRAFRSFFLSAMFFTSDWGRMPQLLELDCCLS